MSLDSEKYVAVTTYRKSGAEITTPTWITGLPDGRLGFWTSSASGKAKRFRNDPRVTLRPSDARGKTAPDAPVTTGTAQLVTSGTEFDAIQAQIKKKYGLMVPISRFFNTIGHLGKGPFPYGDTGVVITLDN